MICGLVASVAKAAEAAGEKPALLGGRAFFIPLIAHDLCREPASASRDRALIDRARGLRIDRDLGGEAVDALAQLGLFLAPGGLH